MIKDKKILITGGKGFIGKHLSEFLCGKGGAVKTFDIKDGNNILDKEYLIDVMRGCDYVIHMASMLGVGKTEKEKIKTLDVNILGMKNVLDACITTGVKKIVFSSSSEVYGEQMRQPIEETAQVSPKSAYGVTKIVCEEYLKAYKYEHNLDYSIVRYFNAYGPRQNNNFVLPRFINMVLNCEKPTLYGRGSQIRSFCYIDDIVNGTYLALTNEKANGEVFNIGNNKEPISMRDLALTIMDVYGRNLGLTQVNFDKSDRKKSREIFVRIPDISKAKNILGYEPKIALRDGIKKTIEYWEGMV